MNEQFKDKWGEILTTTQGDEFTLFVPPGHAPQTQRQLNLYSYFEYIKTMIEGRGYKDSLEMGCGRGTMSSYLNVYSGFNTRLMDLSAEAIDLARKNYELLGLEGEFHVADSKETGLADASVDLVCSIGLLEHLDDYDVVLRETFRILRPGGMMIHLNIPKKASIQVLNSMYRGVSSVLSDQNFKKDYYRNTDKPKDYLGHARASGFADAFTINVCPFPIISPLSLKHDIRLTRFNKLILRVRRSVMKYPFKTSYPVAQAHFLVGTKPAA